MHVTEGLLVTQVMPQRDIPYTPDQLRDAVLFKMSDSFVFFSSLFRYFH